MAVIKIEAKKDTRCTQTICLIQGDRRTQILRFGVNRFDGGVDLSDLVWVIKTVNANGVEDVFDPEAVEIGESRITVDWLVEGSVTDADGLAKYELNGLDTVGEDAVPVIWRGGTGTISLRASISPKFGESDGMTNIEKLILYVDGELQNVIDAGSAATDAAARANRAADNVEDLSGAVERANTAAQRATDAAAAVEDLEGAVTRANSAAALATDGAMRADAAASMAYSAATRATEAAKNVENIEEATVAAYDAADDARMAAEVANTAGLPAAMIYGRRVMGETAKATGNPVSFLPDAGSLLQPVTVLEPQQQGSGDPYPAGGGKNLYDKNTYPFEMYSIYAPQHCVTAPIFLKAGTYTFTGAAGIGTANYVSVYATQNDALNNANQIDQHTFVTNFTESYEQDVYVRLQVNDVGETNYSVCSDAWQIEAGSVATEYAPYENIRPITGWDAVKMNHAGKNLLPNTATSQTINGVTFTVNADGSITANGTATDVVFFNVGRVLLESGVSYILSGCPAGGNNGGNFLMYVSIGSEFYYDFGSSVSFEGTGETRSVFIQVKSGAAVDATFYPMIRLGSTATPYEPYAGTLHTVQIGQTVYGGRFDWLTGKLVAEWALAKGVFARAALDSSGKLYSIKGIPSTVKPYPTSQEGLYEPYIACTALLFKTLEAARIHGKPCISQYSTEIYIGGFVGREAELDALIASDDFAVAYKLVQPIEIQLTPHIISAADPEQTNTLYGDGSIEVEYVKPLHVSIEERVAAALAAAAE